VSWGLIGKILGLLLVILMLLEAATTGNRDCADSGMQCEEKAPSEWGSPNIGGKWTVRSRRRGS